MYQVPADPRFVLPLRILNYTYPNSAIVFGAFRKLVMARIHKRWELAIETLPLDHMFGTPEPSLRRFKREAYEEIKK